MTKAWFWKSFAGSRTMNDFDPGQGTRETHLWLAGVKPFSEPIHRDDVTQIELEGSEHPADSDINATPVSGPSRLDDALLLIYADALDDLERTRISTENRARALADIKGLSESKEYARLRALAADLADLEHHIQLDLQRAMRRHPLSPWVAATKGVGMKQAARLLAAIGDPYIDHRTNTPRTVSQLWAYCGYHVLSGHNPLDHHAIPAGENLCAGHTHQVQFDAQVNCVGVAAKRRKGQRANWNNTAKMRAYLIAVSCMKHTGPFRTVYDTRRAHTAVSHPEWTPGHSHNDALRIVAKAVLKEMWRESKRLYEERGAA